MSNETTLSNLRPQAVPEYEVGLTSNQGYSLTLKVATMLSTSTLVPKSYIGNVSNCVVALNMANRMKADVLMIMQNLYVVHGNPGWSSKFKIATANICGRFTALRFEFSGTEGQDDYACVAWSIEKSTNEKLIGTKVTVSLAKEQGWWSKTGSKWPSMTQKMLMYRAGSWWVDLYAPELCMGLMTDDEIRDIVDVDSKGNVTAVTAAVNDVKSLNRKRKKIDAETITNLETGEITTSDESARESEAEPVKIEMTEDEMNQAMALIEEITNLRETREAVLLAKVKPIDLQKLDGLIESYFAGFDLNGLIQYRNWILNIK